jgi:SHAQKYF class myb-like DNA-binding protein
MIENTGRWTTEEHHLFLQGLEQHGKGWKKIASLIKSRTVVQIRTHAQKYFQKLAKARQGTGGSGGNGVSGSTTMDDNGISLDSGTLIGGMGGISTSSSHATGNGMNVDFNINGSKRRRQANSKKRKAISSVVSSAQRELKKQATANSSASGNAPVAGSSDSDPTVSGISPYLSHFVHPVSSNIDSGVMPSICTSNASISGSALEESLFRFLTPMSESESTSTLASTPPSNVVNEVARKAGANPIVLPSSTDTFKGPSMLPQQQQIFDGGVSPTGVSDIDSFPSWVSGAPPAWFTKGADVDELLTEAEALDWLADSGDLNESYNSPPSTSCLISEPSLLTMCAEDLNTDLVIPMISDQSDQNTDSTIGNSTNCTTNEMPPLLSLFDSTNSISDDDINNIMKREKSINLSSTSLFASATEAADATDHFSLFDTQFDEQAFVTALLDQGGSNDSTNNLLNSY